LLTHAVNIFFASTLFYRQHFEAGLYVVFDGEQSAGSLGTANKHFRPQYTTEISRNDLVETICTHCTTNFDNI